MPGFTSTYGLIYETSKDQPGTSLRAPDEILAEQVEAELERIDQAAADLSDSLDTRPGWHLIAVGSESANFTMDLTGSGKYPAGTFSIIQAELYGAISEVTLLNCRVNGDVTANLHRHGWVITDPNGGTVDNSNSTEGTAWPIAQWGTASSCVGSLKITNTDVSSRLGYQATGARQGANAVRRRTDVTGDLDADRLINSLTVFPTSGSVDTCRWWAWGLIDS